MWTAVEEADPDSGHSVRLFHTRQDEWDEHFEWHGGGAIAGRTPVGRATVAALRMNDTDMIELRTLLAELDLFPEAGG